MKWVFIGIIILWVVLTVAVVRTCEDFGRKMDSCQPGIVTTVHDGQETTTVACTKGKA